MEEPSEEETYYLSPEEYTSSFFNSVAMVHFLMFYFYRWHFLLELYRGFDVAIMWPMFLAFILLIIILYLENEEREQVEIISPTPTNMEFSEHSREEMVTSFFNFVMIGSILLFYLWLLVPLGLFRGLCNFFLVGFFSLTIIMIFIVVDDPIQEARWLLSHKIDKDERKPGDHIYTWKRGGYAHHGICAKDGKVIHFVRGAGQGYGTETGLDISSSSPSHSKDNKKSCKSCGDQSNLKGVIISSCIKCFQSRGDLYLVPYSVTPAFFLAKVTGGTCTLFPSEPPEDVLNRAEVLLRTNDFGVYHIWRNNCESFAYYCKTGLPFFSGQVVSLAAAFVSASRLLIFNTRPTGLVVAEVFFTYCAFRYIIVSCQRLRESVEILRLCQLWDFGLFILMGLICIS